ncbi:MAG: amidohydrolase family protein [Candidatus Latescibacteria bacterium]|jgi:predicted TIM-barrel fold metal-dependent hydrolase|nr:amidohydrolase family protein [Candidatus Latescibacterota bacterium]
MIVDSHVYCFLPGDDPTGYASAREHLDWIQAAQERHHQPAWRISDRSPASAEDLVPRDRTDLSRLPDVRFRIDREKGRVVWTVDGEDYTKQFYPPNLRNLEFTPHSLIAEMDYADVDMALIHTNPMLGRDSAYLADCIAQYPERLRAMAPVDEWRIPDETDAVVSGLEAAILEHGLHAVKFNTYSAYLGSPKPWSGPVYRAFWEAVVSFRVPVFLTLCTGPGDIEGHRSAEEQRKGYLQELALLISWMEQYPDTTVNLTHGFPWRAFVSDDGISLPEEIWWPLHNPNCNLEVCFPVRIGDLFDFPYREVWPALRDMVERIGADRLNWGTDMPFQNRFCTYRQSRQWIEKYCKFLTESDRAMIMGGTAARILGLPSSRI